MGIHGHFLPKYEKGETITMARLKKRSVCWTVCYAVKIRDDEDDFCTATWFAYGRSAEEAKQNFLNEFIINHEEEADDVVIIRVFEGFPA